MPEAQTIALHIYLVKKQFTDHEDVLKNRPGYGAPYQIYRRDSDELLGLLYIQGSKPKLPSWLGFSQGDLGPEEILDRLGGRDLAAIHIGQDRIEGLEGTRHLEVSQHRPDERGRKMKSPLLPFLKRLDRELPRKWDNRLKRYGAKR